MSQTTQFKSLSLEIRTDVSPSDFDVSKLRPVSFLRRGEEMICGDLVRRRAVVRRCNLGLIDGHRILADQDQLAPEFSGLKILLPGTILYNSKQGLRISYLYRLGKDWEMGFDWYYSFCYDKQCCLARQVREVGG